MAKLASTDIFGDLKVGGIAKADTVESGIVRVNPFGTGGEAMVQRSSAPGEYLFGGGTGAGVSDYIRVGSDKLQYSNSSAETFNILHSGNTPSWTEDPTGSTLVKRSVSGYVRATYFNASNGAETSGAAHYFYDTGDGYLRKKTVANVKNELAVPQVKWGSAPSNPKAGDMYFT